MSPVSDRVVEAFAAYDLDPEGSVRLMRAAAEDDDPHACLSMANWHIYYQDNGPTEEDHAKAAGWLARLEQIAARDNADAQYEISKCYRSGEILERNLDRANAWLRRAADAGIGMAQHDLALLLEKGADGLPQDRVASEVWFARALAQDEMETVRLFAARRFRETMTMSDELRSGLRAMLFAYRQLYGFPSTWRMIYRPSPDAFVLVVENETSGKREDRNRYREQIDEGLAMMLEGADVRREIRFATAPAVEPGDEILMSDEIFRSMTAKLPPRGSEPTG